MISRTLEPYNLMQGLLRLAPIMFVLLEPLLNLIPIIHCNNYFTVIFACKYNYLCMELNLINQIANLLFTSLYTYTNCLPPVIGPPVLECATPSPPIDTTQFLIFVGMDIGCDLCVEPGMIADIVTIMCVPRTSRPYDCIMTTPNGTNVLDINDPTGSQITVQTAGNTVSSVSISPVANPDQLPLGFDVLGTWTCVCTNVDGRSVASSTLGSCCKLQLSTSCIYYRSAFCCSLIA